MLCFSVRVLDRPLTTNANVFTRPSLAHGPARQADGVAEAAGLGVDLAHRALGLRGDEASVVRLQRAGPAGRRHRGSGAQRREARAVPGVERGVDDPGELHAAQPVRPGQPGAVVEGRQGQATADHAGALGRGGPRPGGALPEPDADQLVQGLGVLVVRVQQHLVDDGVHAVAGLRREDGGAGRRPGPAPVAGADAVGPQPVAEVDGGVHRRVIDVALAADQGPHRGDVPRDVRRLPSRGQARRGEEVVVGVDAHRPHALCPERGGGGAGERVEGRAGQRRVTRADEHDPVARRPLPHHGRQAVGRAEGRQDVVRGDQLRRGGGHQRAVAALGPQQGVGAGVHDRSREGRAEPRRGHPAREGAGDALVRGRARVGGGGPRGAVTGGGTRGRRLRRERGADERAGREDTGESAAGAQRSHGEEARTVHGAIAGKRDHCAPNGPYGPHRGAFHSQTTPSPSRSWYQPYSGSLPET